MPGVGRGAWETLGSRASRSSRRSAPRLQSADRAVLAPWARGGNRRVTLSQAQAQLKAHFRHRAGTCWQR